jgi:hypothetical protein
MEHKLTRKEKMCKRNTFKQEIEVYMSTYEKVLYLQSIQGNYTPLMTKMNYYALQHQISIPKNLHFPGLSTSILDNASNHPSRNNLTPAGKPKYQL